MFCSKYEEIYPPDVTEFTFITDDTYSKEQVVRMEMMIMNCLRCEMSPPTANIFASRFLKVLGIDVEDKVYSLSMVSCF